MEKVWIKCNSCGADSFQELSSVGEWHIGRCSQCSLIYVNPTPFFNASEDFSEMSLDFQYTQYMHLQISQKTLDFERQQMRWQLAQATSLGATPTQGRLLDVGCGSGASVRAAVDLGWEALGIDIDPQLIKHGREQLGVDLRSTTLLEAGLPDTAFDFIRLRDVIEHLPNPYDILLEIRRLLAPHGVVLIVTPNENGLPTRARLLLGKERNRVATVPPPHHLHGFEPSTLQRILERAGLSVQQITTTTPVDRRYVTSNNMRSTNQYLYRLIWRSSKALGMGSVLVAWATKS